MKELDAREKICPLRPTPTRKELGNPCAGKRCLWWCGEDEGYCIVTVLEPLAEALTKLAEPQIFLTDPGKPITPEEF